MADSLGDRMKIYEGQYDARLTPGLPALARIDGKAFHTFTKDLHRPFDSRFTEMMCITTMRLVRETSALIGYTQSDEISLLWYATRPETQIYFNGRVMKMVGDLAAMATLYFNQQLHKLPHKSLSEPRFDARVWVVPTQEEAVNYFLWRERDAIKNSISMAASEYYSHKELMHKNSSEKQDMLWNKGVNWNNYPPYFKRGTFIKRILEETPFSAEEIEKLPPNHEARRKPGLKISRHIVKPLNTQKFSQILNKKQFLFGETYADVSTS